MNLKKITYVMSCHNKNENYNKTLDDSLSIIKQ